MKTKVVFLALMIAFCGTFRSEAQAQVQVIRGGNENPMIAIAKSTIYGAGTGLLLGLALTLVVDEDTGDILKWSFVSGTFVGFGVGVYHVANRPQPSSALQFDGIHLARIRVPETQLASKSANAYDTKKSLDFRVAVVSFSL
jgi:hypothetical protein